MSPKAKGVKVILLLKEQRNFEDMHKRIFVIIALSVIANITIAQTSVFSSMIQKSVESYIHDHDSILGALDRPHSSRSFVLPELIGADKINFSASSAYSGSPIVWTTRRSAVKSLLRKNRSDNYNLFYRVALNIEDGEVVVYVTTGYKLKMGEHMIGRYSYGLKDGAFCLHSIKYIGVDLAGTTIVARDTPNTDKIIENRTTNEIFDLFLDEFGSSFSDTIDVICSTTIDSQEYPDDADNHFVFVPYGSSFPKRRIMDVADRHFIFVPYHALTKRTNEEQMTALSIDYTFNNTGDIMFFFRLIDIPKQKGRYHKMQQTASSCFVVVLSPDSDGLYQISSYHRINGRARIPQ